MKFAIFTHVIHKKQHNLLHAYAPYVNEMNLWLKYVDEVLIVAPISEKKITSIESKYQFHSNREQRHSALDAESHNLKTDEQIAMSQTPRNDEAELHSEQREAISSNGQVAKIQTPYKDEKSIELIEIQAFDLTSLINRFKAVFKIPKILMVIYKTMKWADHIHLRCPGNIGLLASVVQILFPKKPKTIKYAGNWDPKSRQPWSYRFQKWIISNTFLTKNTKVLVYGEWPNQTKNIVPFFTASYSEREIEEANCHPKLVSGSNEIKHDNRMLKQVRHEEKERLSEQSEAVSSKDTTAMLYSTPNNDKAGDNSINFIFVGTLSKGKQPILSVKVVKELKRKGYNVKLSLYGEGVERADIENYIEENNLQNEVILFGNVNKEIVKQAYKKAHFLLFISKSEGWPKVVAEAMFWGCLPISSSVSCIPYMLGNGIRGTIVNQNTKEIVLVIENYLHHKEKYQEQTRNAMEWSRQYTLEKFEKEIKKLLC